MEQKRPIGVLDTSAIIRIKESFPSNQLQAIFNSLTQLMQDGDITFPRQVVEELSRWAKPDLPFTWAKANQSYTRFTDPPFATLREVMARVGNVVDPKKDREDADPYVLAMALYLQAEGHEVTVVSEDRLDYLDHISIFTACQQLGLQVEGISKFLQDRGILPPR